MENEDADALYLKNQRQWVSKYLAEESGRKSGYLQKYGMFHVGGQMTVMERCIQEMPCCRRPVLLTVRRDHRMHYRRKTAESRKRMYLSWQKPGISRACCETARKNGQRDGARNSGDGRRKAARAILRVYERMLMLIEQDERYCDTYRRPEGWQAYYPEDFEGRYRGVNDRWKMNRIGFVNFWLYDEEDFRIRGWKAASSWTEWFRKIHYNTEFYSFCTGW